MILLGQTSRQGGKVVWCVRWWVNVTLDGSWQQPRALLRQGYLTPPAPPLLACCTCTRKKGGRNNACFGFCLQNRGRGTQWLRAGFRSPPSLHRLDAIGSKMHPSAMEVNCEIEYNRATIGRIEYCNNLWP